MLRSMVLRKREEGGGVGVVRKKKEECICIGTLLYLLIPIAPSGA